MLRIPGAISPAKPLAAAIAIGLIASAHADGISISLPNPSCASYTVNATPATDTPDTLTLDEALARFSSECNAASDSAAITIADSLAGMTLSNGVSLPLNNARQLSIVSTATTPPVITVESNSYPPLFSVADNATLKLQGLHLIGSSKISMGSPAEQSAIMVTGANLELKEVMTRDFYASDKGAAIQANDGATVTITDSVFVDNMSASSTGGAIAVANNINGATAMTITGSEFHRNSSEVASGGALYAENTDLTITDSIFTENQAGSSIGADSSGGGAVAAVGGSAEFNKSRLTITGSEFRNNQTYGHGGALLIDSSNPVTVTDSVFDQNTATSVDMGATGSQAQGGAISMERVNTTLSANTFSGNQANGKHTGGNGLGGALHIGATNYFPATRTGGVITITDSTFHNNSTTGDTLVGGRAYGGGIYVDNSDAGQVVTVNISGSTLSQNSAQDGGALAHRGRQGLLSILNSTLTGNSASVSAAGIYLDQPATDSISIAHSTLVNNILGNSDTVGSGLYLTGFPEGSGLSISHTVIANNSGGVGNLCVNSNTEASLIVDHSFIADAGAQAGCAPIDSVAGNLIGSNDIPLDPKLQDLGLYGGNNFVFMPAADSPLVDAGNVNIEGAPETDQRGNARIFNGVIDLGAVERGANNSATVTIPGSGSGGGGTLGAALLGLLCLLGLRRKQ
ncbi:choice-of-anchor Q domain-containing protein [Alcanivorax sediminis]|uniref:CSLREA domain-containing protein n=1 Tax=Alcanivorax sediminis TaxID=2663008 RepID=A0A6N7LR15_9GAMM|nr:choice-of-anchor Q domain-containing protein [Alcanivorax sediminis]MQX52633.1 hypothetical protein [Alcanivorax sediminis]